MVPGSGSVTARHVQSPRPQQAAGHVQTSLLHRSSRECPRDVRPPNSPPVAPAPPGVSRGGQSVAPRPARLGVLANRRAPVLAAAEAGRPRSRRRQVRWRARARLPVPERLSFCVSSLGGRRGEPPGSLSRGLLPWSVDGRLCPVSSRGRPRCMSVSPPPLVLVNTPAVLAPAHPGDLFLTEFHPRHRRRHVRRARASSDGGHTWVLELNPDTADTVRAPGVNTAPPTGPSRLWPPLNRIHCGDTRPGSNKPPGHVQTGRGRATGATGIPESPVPPVPATPAHAVCRDAFPGATRSCLPCGHGAPSAQISTRRVKITARHRADVNL